MQQAVSQLATMALEQTRRAVERALRTWSRGRPRVMRVSAVGNLRMIAEIRRRLRQILKGLREEKSGELGLVELDAERWTLTVAFAPAAHARS
jgi:hypothetical protein